MSRISFKVSLGLSIGHLIRVTIGWIITQHMFDMERGEMPPGQDIPEFKIDTLEVPSTEQKGKEEVLYKEEDFLDSEDESLSPEIREAITDQGLEVMRQILRGIPDSVVFASTAMYLHGKEHGIDELKVPPGDFDAAVFDENSLRQVREQLGNVPGVEFQNDGKFIQFLGEQAKVLKGELRMLIQTPEGPKPAKLPFEIFQQSRIVNKEIAQYQTMVQGFRVLNFEGLKKQYLANLQMESRMKRSADEVSAFLTNPEMETRVRSALEEQTSGQELEGWMQELLSNLDLTQSDLQEFYEQVDEMKQEPPEASKEPYYSRISKILAGVKTKIPKRLKNIKELTDVSRIEISDPLKEE